MRPGSDIRRKFVSIFRPWFYLPGISSRECRGLKLMLSKLYINARGSLINIQKYSCTRETIIAKKSLRLLINYAFAFPPSCQLHWLSNCCNSSPMAVTIHLFHAHRSIRKDRWVDHRRVWFQIWRKSLMTPDDFSNIAKVSPSPEILRRYMEGYREKGTSSIYCLSISKNTNNTIVGLYSRNGIHGNLDHSDYRSDGREHCRWLRLPWILATGYVSSVGGKLFSTKGW